MSGILQIMVGMVILVSMSIPLGKYIYKVMVGDEVFLSKVLAPIEKWVYKIIGIREDQLMSGTQYILSIAALSLFGVISLMLLMLTQQWLPMNPNGVGNMSFDLALNTAVSFVTNTNWQAYSGETQVSYFTQMMGLTVQSFISPAVGLAVVFALMRAFVVEKQQAIGNFWKDLTRCLLYILLPLSVFATFFLIGQGVVQSFAESVVAQSLETGQALVLPLGPAASQIAIKILGTNGGGFFGANGAFPFENPTPLSNIVQILMIVVIPAALCVTFGQAVNNKKEGRMLYIVMLTVFTLALAGAYLSETQLAPSFVGVVGGNLEGKEVMHGISGSTFWGVTTTAVANGAVNAVHNSFTPLATAIFMFLMQLGEIIFGGAGSGLYGMISFILLTVFIVGLMVGRTPEYLGKKIEPAEIKMVCLMILIPPMITLIGGAVMTQILVVVDALTNTGVHAVSQILYNAASLGNNNGSAFAGMVGNLPSVNYIGATMMLASRFLPMFAVIHMAASLSRKQRLPQGTGSLSTTSATFTVTTILIVIIIGALSFLPVLALGPIAEALTGL